MDFEVETLVTHALRGEGFDASEDGTGRGTLLVPVKRQSDFNCVSCGEENGGTWWPICEWCDHNHEKPIAFSCKDYGNDATEDLAPTLRSMNHDGSHQNGGGQMAVAFDMRGREGGSQFEGPHETANIRAASGGSSRSYVAEQWAVRRLLPAECETLQGLPVGFTAIPYKRRKIAADEAEQCAMGGAAVWQEDGQWFTDCMADGPRYKMIGNSMARPVIRWILQRVDAQLSAAQQPERAVA